MISVICIQYPAQWKNTVSSGRTVWHASEATDWFTASFASYKANVPYAQYVNPKSQW